jgi:hypothetical protein
MPPQLGASLQSERGSMPEQPESDMSLKFTAGDLTVHRLIEEEIISCRCVICLPD